MSDKHKKKVKSCLKIINENCDTEFDYGIASIIVGYDPSSRPQLVHLINSLKPGSLAKGQCFINFNFQKNSGDAFSYICHDLDTNMYYHDCVSNSGAFTTKIKIKMDDTQKEQLFKVFIKYYRYLINKYKK